MRLVTVFGFVLAAALGLYMYSWQMQKVASASGADSPQGVIDSVAVKTDLLMMGGAEQQQLALEGRYLSFEDLRKKGVTMPESRGPYTYSVELPTGSFLIKATYHAPEGKKAMPNLTIGPDMKVKSEGAPAADDEAGDTR